MRIAVLQPPGRQDAIIPHVYRPRMAAALEALSMAVYQETTLSFREAEGARFRIALINGCLMCQGYRIAADLQQALQAMDSDEAPNAAGRGEAPDEDYYRAVHNWRTSPVFTYRERLAIDYADRIALSPQPLPYDDRFWDALKANYDDGEIADLTYSINTWIATGRVVHVLDLDGACAVHPTAVAAE